MGQTSSRDNDSNHFCQASKITKTNGTYFFNIQLIVLGKNRNQRFVEAVKHKVYFN